MTERKQGLPKELVSHCKTPEDKEVFLQQLRGAIPVLNRYRDLLEKRITKIEDKKEIDYDCPSWSHKQADANGYVRAIKEILKLLPPTTMEK